MKICVIGAGITGLTVAKALSDRHQVEIYEKESDIGGIAKVKSVNGVAYHTVGGHCMNYKNSLRIFYAIYCLGFVLQLLKLNP